MNKAVFSWTIPVNFNAVKMSKMAVFYGKINGLFARSSVSLNPCSSFSGLSWIIGGIFHE